MHQIKDTVQLSVLPNDDFKKNFFDFDLMKSAHWGFPSTTFMEFSESTGADPGGGWTGGLDPP